MTKGKRIFWGIVVVLGVVWLYHHFHRAPDAADTFTRLASLTPEQLAINCGPAEQETSGFVVEDDGIRDLRYKDISGNPVFLRFISDDGETWHSLGAWENVNAPDDLGAPIDAVEAARRLSCAIKAVPSSSMIVRPSASTSLAAILYGQEFGVPVRPNPQPIPTPMPRPTPLPTPTPLPMPTPLPTPMPLPRPSPLPMPSPFPGGGAPTPHTDDEPKPGGGGEGGSDDSNMGGMPAIVPCPPDADPCKILEYVEFAFEMNQAIQAERENNFEKAMDIVKRQGVLVVHLPELTVNRVQVVKAIFQLEAKVINAVTAQLHADVAKLQPFPQETAEQKAQKMAVVQQDDLAMRQTWRQAVEETRPTRQQLAQQRAEERAEAHADAREERESRTMSFHSDAYNQLVNIHISGNWP